MKTHIRYLLAGLIIALLMLSAVPGQPAQAQAERQVWAFYLSFWGGPGWNQNWMSDSPLRGQYDAKDPGTAAAQIAEAQSAGIDAFVVNWFGREDDQTTLALMNLMDQAWARGFQVGAAVDVFDGNYNRSYDTIRNNVAWIINDRVAHGAYLRYNGKPVIVFAFQENAGLTTSQWLALRNELDPDRQTIWLAEGLSGCCLHNGAFDGMYAFNLAWSNGSASRYARESAAVEARGGMWVPTVHPGWNEDAIAVATGRPNPTSARDRAGGQFLRNTWAAATSVDPEVILVVSWNEFYEGSAIEPSVNYGTQSLDILRELIPAWKAGAASTPTPSTPTASSPTGQTLEALRTLNVRTGPSTGYEILGTIRPGTSYAVLGQQGQWYRIDFNGQEGWVYGPLARVQGAASGGSSGGSGSDTATDNTPVNPPSPTGLVAEAKYTVNVRSGPGTDFDVIGQITPGTRYAILGNTGSWYEIDYNGQSAYVYIPLVSVLISS